MLLVAAAIAADRPPVRLDVPALDVPFDVLGYPLANPSMAQSLALTFDAAQLAHGGLARLSDRYRAPIPRLAVSLGIGVPLELLVDVVAVAWLHEEWHRSVLARYGIASRNGVYVPRYVLSGLIPVDHVADADLARLKADGPADLVRLSAAGMEAQDELNVALERDSFFHGDHRPLRWGAWTSGSMHFVTILANAANNALYVTTCASPSVEATMAAQDAAESERERDFTGLDCDGWVYDLFRPDEPYAARGPHPSGGIDRYRYWGDLSAEEQDYLRLQSTLTWLDVLDPAIVGIDGFTVGETDFSIAVGHMLLAYGFDVEQRVMVRKDGTKLAFRLHESRNAVRWFGGVEGDAVDVPVGPLELTFGAGLWLQPANLRYDDTAARPVGRVRGTAIWKVSPRVWPTLTVDAKSAGQVAGVVYLDPNVSVRGGVTATVW